MRTVIGKGDSRYKAWRVYRDLSDIENDLKKDRLGISGGLLSLGSRVITTNSVSLGGTLNVSTKSYLAIGSSDYKDIFLDMQTKKYLYAKITLATYAVELEYSDSPPHTGAAIPAITLLSETIQRIPLAYIDENKVVIDIRPLGGGSSGSTSYSPFETYGSGGLKVKVAAGNIVWHDKDIAVQYAQDTTLACAEITCGANTTTYIYIALDNEFSSSTPVVTVVNANSIPSQPNPPARRYLKIATVVTDSTSVSSVTVNWKGNIIWPTVFGFWL